MTIEIANELIKLKNLVSMKEFEAYPLRLMDTSLIALVSFKPQKMQGKADTKNISCNDWKICIKIIKVI